ncbi:MAG: D-alanyl-D-alanine carboxypeptidase [Burkholderiaceae bacterium]|nr:D-alanyl-D-alanine carboxypeptidase [Microbacteriaceae bacterium]
MPPTRRQILRRRRVAAGAVLAVVLGTGAYVPVTLLAPVGSAVASVAPADVPDLPVSVPAFPDFGASAIGAIGFDGVLAAGGSADPRPIASISKIVTALMVLEEHPLAAGEDGPSITFTSADVALYAKYAAVGGKVEPVTAGLTLTQREALEVVLVSSANNYAESMADWAFGSTSGFTSAADTWLTSQGLTQTRLVEPTGMSPLNVSSTADLVGIAKLALANETIAGIVRSSTADVPFIGAIENSNTILGIDGIDGIKTGTLDEAGSCLLFSADVAVGSATVTVVGVVLGAVDRTSVNDAVRSLLDSAAAGFHEVSLTVEGEEFASYATEWDQRATAVAASATSVVVWSDTPVTEEVDALDVASGASGDPVGQVRFRIGDAVIEVPLVLSGEIGDPGVWWRLSHPLNLIS